MRSMINQGQKLSNELLKVCMQDIPGKTSNVSLSRDLLFNHKCTPCRLVVPLEASLMATLPTATEYVNVRLHKAFPKDTVTISGMDNPYSTSLVLTSFSILGRCYGS